MNMRLANEAEMLEENVELEIDLEEPYTIFDVSCCCYALKCSCLKYL